MLFLTLGANLNGILVERIITAESRTIKENQRLLRKLNILSNGFLIIPFPRTNHLLSIFKVRLKYVAYYTI